MNTLDKVYNLTIDIKNIDVKYNSYAKFFDDDRETSVIRIKLLNDKTPMNLENCIVEAYFILADNTYHNEACKIINTSEGIVELQLCQKCLVKGENIVRLSILKDNEISNTPVITYEVRKGLYSDNPSFNDNPLTPILSQMLLDIKVTKVNQIELQERYEQSFPRIESKIKEVDEKIVEIDNTKDNFISSINTKVDTKISELDNAKSDMTTTVSNKVNEVETRFNALTSQQQQSSEVIDARDGEISLKARLDRDIEKAKQVYVNVEGSNISTDSSVGYAKDVEILGNTIQNEEDLADIRSVGEKVEGQELYEIPVLCTNGLDSKNSEYQEDKLTILSPVQLEKVGDVADRIIEKDGVWGVEKNTFRSYLKDFTWQINRTQENTTSFQSVTEVQNLTSNVYNAICKGFKMIYSWDDEEHYHYGTYYSLNRHVLTIAKNRVATIDDLNKFLLENNNYVVCIAEEPTFIPLPHDQQIKLRTFANKTNISFGCEIEGAIKAQVPKSLGATVNTHTEQISNLNKELDRVKKLEESTVSTVTTESDFTTVEATSNGYFEDVKLEGKTLANIVTTYDTSKFSFNEATKQEDGYYKLQYGATVNDSNVIPRRGVHLYKPNTTYTLIVDIKENTAGTLLGISTINSCIDPKTISKRDFVNLTGISTITFKTREDITISDKGVPPTYDLYFGIWKDGGDLSKHITFKYWVLEGDHTQNPPSYFEGLKSVGQSASEDEADEIVVSSVKGDGNLVEYIELNGVIVANGQDYTDNKYVRTNYITVEPNQTYYIKLPTNALYENCIVYFYDSNKSYLGYKGGLTSEFTTVTNTKFIRIDMKKADNTGNTQEDINNCDFVVSKCRVSEYISYQSDKKRLLYYNEETQAWEKPILRQWDSIEKHSDGKYYYHQKSAEVVLNGSENWLLHTTNYFKLAKTDMKIFANSIKPNMISDRYVTMSLDNSNTVDSSISNGNGSAFIYIYNKSISTVEALKQSLQANNVTVVYQLAEEKVYECTNIDLITYANETNYIVESGVLSPKTTLKVHNNISNVVSLLQKKVSLLESNVTSYMITQNRLMLASRYNADTVSFKVDVATLRNSFEYDNDLYELILNNILVGKDNYNREYIENLIIFYWMDFIISDEMYSTLFEIIEEQHNPKIEEETPLI